MFTCDSIGGTAEFNEGVLVTKGSTLLPSVRMESFDSEGKESKAWRTERFLHTHRELHSFHWKVCPTDGYLLWDDYKERIKWIANPLTLPYFWPRLLNKTLIYCNSSRFYSSELVNLYYGLKSKALTKETLRILRKTWLLRTEKLK